MWILRFLNGPLAGQIVPLTKESTLLGRAPGCDVKIPSPNVSKEHTRIELFDDKLIVTDAGSRNGTFINGVKVRSSKARNGDKIGLHDIFIEVQKVPDSWAARFQSPYPQYGMPMPYYGNAAYQMNPDAMAQMPPDGGEVPSNDFFGSKVPRWTRLAQEYVDQVVMPGLYKLPEMFDFKWVLAGFMAAFIILVTALSTIPLMRILRASIQEESQQHAMTIATTLARVNMPALAQGQDSSVSVEIATSRPGVSKAFIISNVDGNVIAPPNMAGTYPDLPYINEGRKLDKESVNQVSDTSIVAMYPVRVYNSETGAQAITHWAVVFYDMSSLAVDNGQVLSLFITTLFISLVLGLILFFFLYKLVEYPIRSMNIQLDTALKEGQETVSVTYQFPAIQLLASNVSSALTRAVNGSEGGGGNRALEHDRNREITNLVELVGFAAMGIRAADLTIAAVNQAFEQRIGTQSAQLTTMTVNEINDQALKLSIKDLTERVDQNPDEMATNELEFNGLNFNIVMQAVFGTSKIAYYLVILLPASEGEG